ncbi:hypothetical protein NAT51_02590 [Flavobacterium amniphilum]|uniref:hypothetical protein n=1 Tax=Flavobacterium amniphilum TaxID=1834035 RepID=UPI00202A010D|nr:hypothetical protein [Flavobacterium amniphilum]MCL9804394.1 hypothetical protein [Flavobacterium amniphilum]
MKNLLLLFLLSFNFTFSQENFVNSYVHIYGKDGLVYKVKDNQLFTGTISFIKKNGVIRHKTVFNNGYLTNTYLYYNKSSRGKISEETVYYQEKVNEDVPKLHPKKIISYHSTGEIYNIKYYDLEGENYLEESFEDGKLTYSCEYKNGKKHGKEYCTTRKCGEETVMYSKGKKI